MANPALAGWLFDSAGLAVSGATVNAYEAGDTATVLATTTTGAGGGWSIANSSIANPDVEIVNGTEITRFKYGDKIALTQVDAQSVVIRNDSATSSFAITLSPPTLTGNQTFTLPDATGTLAMLGSEQLITGSNAAASNFPVTIRKTADQSLTSDSALTNDTHLQIALSSATTYKVELMWAYSHGAAGDLVGKWSVPTGANLRGVWQAQATSSVTTPIVGVTEASSFGMPNNAGSWATHFIGLCETSATAGNLIPQFRQDGADATVTTLRAGSFMTVQKVSS